MIKKILVAQDGSRNSAAALEYALYLARGFGAGLRGLFVVDTILLEGPFFYDLSASMGIEPVMNVSEKMRAVLEERGKAVLQGFEEACSAASVEHETFMTTGIVAKELCRAAQLADLVVMGRKGDTEDFETGLLGSVAEGVLRRCAAPVFLAPPVFSPVESPLLVYDGSENANDAMRLAAEFVKVMDVGLTVATVGPSKEADEHLVDAMDYLKSYDIRASFKELEGEPALEIVRYYDENGHDLLFMGATHRSRVVELVLGSTAEYVLRAVGGPVVVVR